MIIWFFTLADHNFRLLGLEGNNFRSVARSLSASREATIKLNEPLVEDNQGITNFNYTPMAWHIERVR